MKVKFDGYNWLVRLEKGEKLVESLVEVARKQNIKTAWIYGIGAAGSAEIGYFDSKSKKYAWNRLDKNLEILSLQGNLAEGGDKPMVHLHGVFSDDTRKVSTGGCFFFLKIFIYKRLFKRPGTIFDKYQDSLKP